MDDWMFSFSVPGSKYPRKRPGEEGFSSERPRNDGVAIVAIVTGTAQAPKGYYKSWSPGPRSLTF